MTPAAAAFVTTYAAREDTLTPEQAEDLLLVDGFVRRPPPELAVLPLDVERITTQVAGERFSRARVSGAGSAV